VIVSVGKGKGKGKGDVINYDSSSLAGPLHTHTYIYI